MHKVVSDYTNYNVESSAIKVFVRVRPVDESQSEARSNFIGISATDEKFISIKDPDEARQKYGEVNFNFDRVFWTEVEQERIFEIACKQQVDHIMNGVNSCCFAYGQTGSGKTYTMFGEEGEARGIIPRSVEYILESAADKSDKFDIAMFSTFIEIYNDQIRDLGKAYLVANGLQSSTSAALYEKTSDIFASLEQKRNSSFFAPAFRKPKGSQGLPRNASSEKISGSYGSQKEVQDEYREIHYEIYEDAEGNVFVKDISVIPVRSAEEVFSVMESGLRLRATHETKLNTTSSRSHCVFSLTVVQRSKVSGEAIKGTINLVDLAGSERVKKSESVGSRLREALHINTSLTALGKVIMALDPSSENTHIPYRDSKLTRILQNTLSGNSFTTLLATIHPSPAYFEECLSTLQFANRCRNVRNHPRVNYVGEGEDKDKKIKRLLDEISQLRLKLSLLEAREREGGGAALSPTKFIAILQSLGLDANLTPDGQMVLDGKVISLEATGLSEIFGAGGSDGPLFGGFGGIGSANGRYLAADNAEYKKRNRELKDSLERVLTESEEMRAKLAVCSSALSASQSESRLLAGQYERQLQVLRTSLAKDHANVVAELLEHNQKLLQLHPPDKKAPAEELHLKSSKSIEYLTRDEHLSALRDLQGSTEEEVRLARLQYESFVSERDADIVAEIEKITAQRAKDTAMIKTWEKEIVSMYRYVEYLESSIEDFERVVASDVATLRSPPHSHCFEIAHRVVTACLARTELEDAAAEKPRFGHVERIKELALSRPRVGRASGSRPQSASAARSSGSGGKSRPSSAIPKRARAVTRIGMFMSSERRNQLLASLCKLTSASSQEVTAAFTYVMKCILKHVVTVATAAHSVLGRQGTGQCARSARAGGAAREGEGCIAEATRERDSIRPQCEDRQRIAASATAEERSTRADSEII